MRKTFAPSNRRTQTLLGQLSFPNQVQTAVKNQAPSLLSRAGPRHYKSINNYTNTETHKVKKNNKIKFCGDFIEHWTKLAEYVVTL